MMRTLSAALACGFAALAGHASAAIDDKAAAALAGKAQCTACHHLERRLVGPAFKDIAARRRHEKDGAATLMRKVREGGVGAYGQVPMPPNPQARISDDDLGKLVAWILSK